jgi:hypothetical protein
MQQDLIYTYLQPSGTLCIFRFDQVSAGVVIACDAVYILDGQDLKPPILNTKVSICTENISIRLANSEELGLFYSRCGVIITHEKDLIPGRYYCLYLFSSKYMFLIDRMEGSSIIASYIEYFNTERKVRNPTLFANFKDNLFVTVATRREIENFKTHISSSVNNYTLI